MNKLTIADRNEITEFSNRLAEFLPGGSQVPADIRFAMAQIALAHDLDPFLNELWPIPKKNKQGEVSGWGLMVGIAGWRASAHRTGEYWGRRFEKCSEEERGWLGAGPKDIAMKCIVMRRKSGGQPAEWDGYGMYKAGEFTKMNPLFCARLRAERDAMKGAFPISGMGTIVEVADESGEAINGEYKVHQPSAESPEEILARGKRALGRDEGDLVASAEPERGPDLEGLAAYEAMGEHLQAEPPAQREVAYEAEPLPTTGQALFNWHKKLNLSVRDVNDILGMTPTAWVAAGGTFESSARTVAEHISKQKAPAA